MVSSPDAPSLFGARTNGAPAPHEPLAVRMRPRALEEVVGQQHLLAPGSPLTRLVSRAAGADTEHAPASRAQVSVVMWGPPGTGKTTLASLVSQATGGRFVQLSAVSAGVKDVREVIESAKRERELYDRSTVLFLDEVHRFSKTQQDALLPAVEHGWITLVAATTENPSFSVVAPLLSRSLVVALRPLDEHDIEALIERAVADPRGLGGSVALTDEARDYLVRVAGGDARRALTVLEAASASIAPGAATGAPATVELAAIELAAATAAPRYDRDGDQHYDIASALIKSVRGSDVDAALHYLARMVEAGEDPRFIARRLVILASEDIGLADSNALPLAVAAMQAVSFVGLPEARITLAHAVVYLALAPKSNAAYQAINAALSDVERGLAGRVPANLRDASSKYSRAEGAGQGYVYPHDLPDGLARQEYAPEAVRDRRYYYPGEHGAEARLGPLLDRIRHGLGRSD